MTTPKKFLYRRNASGTSVEAAMAVDHTTWETVVFSEIKNAGAKGLTQDELLELYPSVPYSTICARFSALTRKGLIHRPGFKRKGRSGNNQLVMLAKPEKE